MNQPLRAAIVDDEPLARRRLSDLVRADPARTPLQPQWNGRVFALPLEEGEGRAVIRDGQACFNLNSLMLGQGEVWITEASLPGDWTISTPNLA